MNAERRLQQLRERIAELDAELVRLISERRRLAVEIGAVKSELGLPVLDPQREAEVVRRAAAVARELGIDEELTRDVLWRIIASTRDAQIAGETATGEEDREPAPPPEERQVRDG
ncbi:MAG: chorismate mutase [Gemmatimonadetes bacterium]|nr:chorismate mutase [Gemmatimonadota bacterium]